MAAATAEGMSKLDAVRMALKTLGNDAMPVAIQSHVLKEYGVDMSTAHVSNYKTMILRGDKPGKKRRKRRKKAAAAAAPVEAVAVVTVKKAVAPASNGATVTVAEIEAVKGLVGRVGQSTLKELIDVISN